MNLTDLWEKAQNNIKDKVGSTSYETWFSIVQVREKDLNTLIIETPDDFFKNWIVEHYQDFINDSLNTLSPNKIDVEYAVNSNLVKKSPLTTVNEFETRMKRPDGISNSRLNERFTFDNFVIGSSNRFACAASLAVAESPARAYNPLLIYGPVGLGKTHLIQAITHKIRERHPHMKHNFMTSEQFTNELIDAIRTRSTPQFRKRFRDVDVLLIDYIQFIAGKESTQEEFFHTFNYLHDNKKQIIITSDRPPKEITNLEERLRSRFAWGLITDIQPPDYETRVAILNKKMENETVKVPYDVISFIAEEVKTNIRELEGALVRVMAYSLLEDQPISLEVTKNVLKDMLRQTTKVVSVDNIQKTVCEYFNISLSDLRSHKRNKNIVLARHVAMYLSRQIASMSLPEIGNIFGGKDHTTVLHACKKIDQEIKNSNDFKRIISKLTFDLKQ